LLLVVHWLLSVRMLSILRLAIRSGRAVCLLWRWCAVVEETAIALLAVGVLRLLDVARRSACWGIL
jgi:hypothetical protein